MAAESAIAVQPPVDGWASGRYELLKTSTTGLTLVLTDAPEGATLGCTTAEGMTTYFADVTVAGEVEVVCEDETLLAAAKSQIRLAMDAAGVALTGIVKIKVVPGTGNKIVSELATGYVHVYGTSNLAEKMKYISKVGFDLTPYLKPDTKGEALLQVELGTHSFLKVKVEPVEKAEGETE